MQTKSTNGNQRTMKPSELVRRFLPYFRPYRGMLALDLFCAMLTTLCDLVLPMIVRSITGLASSSAAALAGANRPNRLTCARLSSTVAVTASSVTGLRQSPSSRGGASAAP